MAGVLDSFGQPKPPIPLRRKFLLRIDYPNSPAEVLWNAMKYEVDENFANDVAKEYLGNVRIELQDDNGLQYRKYGRIVLREIRRGPAV